MLRIQQLKLPAGHSPEALRKRIVKELLTKETELMSYKIRRHSLDARKKPQIYDVYTIDVRVRHELQIYKRLRNKNITVQGKEPVYRVEPFGTIPLNERPVIIGTGPAGLFCGYELARMGYCPILLERGADVDTRVKNVQDFWEGGELLPESNVQFGEGGAGTFSDGKLNTLTHDTCGRNREVLRLFALHGAPEEILYESRPHIGTDILAGVVKNIRNAIISMGGDVRFHAKVTDIHISEKSCCLSGLTVRDTKNGEESFLNTSLAVLAIGHSARDTFSMLRQRNIHMEPKAFAAGVRVEHPQALVNDAQYGKGHSSRLPAAAYKLTAKTGSGRGVYTFCMCPGGYVVNASSEAGHLAVNGMSYSGRNGENANSAVIVTVHPDDFARYGETPDDVLSGMHFQRYLEERAFFAGQGKVPVQLFGDFCKNRPSAGPGTIRPHIKGGYTWGDVRGIFPEFLSASLEEGIKAFDQKLSGFAASDAVLSGVESRTSSPVRIVRCETLESSVSGLYPCGEGAGYAGGITSAAADGLRVAEAVSRIYRPFEKAF